MDGKIMGFTPPDKFSFDLQRFTEQSSEDGAKFSVTTGTGDSAITKYYTEDSDFKNEYLKDATSITILGNLTLSEDEVTIPSTISIPTDKNVTLDLNGKTLKKTTDGTAIQIENGSHTFTLTDTSSGKTGKIIHTHDPIGTVTAGTTTSDTIIANAKAARYGAKAVISVATPNSTKNENANGAKFVMNGGTIQSNVACIYGASNSEIEINSGATVQSYMSGAIYLGKDIIKDGNKDSNGGQKLTVNGGHVITGETLNDTEETDTACGTLTSSKNSNLPAIQVSGNYEEGNSNQITIDIKGNSEIEFRSENFLKKGGNGTNKDDYVGNTTAIYVGGNAKLTLADSAKVKTTATGVEMRSGELEVNDNVSIESSATEYAVRPNSSGSTIFGAAIAISQHTTGQTIKTTINSDNVTAKGAIALAVENPENKDSESGAVEATINGGTFESVNTGSSAIAAQNADSRVSIKVKKATFVGTLKSTFAETTGTTKSAAIEIAKDGEVTVQQVDGDGNVISEETYDSSALQYKIKDAVGTEGQDGYTPAEYLTVKHGWNEITIDEKKDYRYMVAGTNVKEAEAKATLAPKKVGEESSQTDSTDTLALTDVSVTESLAVDLTDSIFGGLSSAFTKLDASTATNPLYIMGNQYITEITGGTGNDTLTAVAEDGVTLDGGNGNDSLVGGSGEDTFVYSAGKDTIENYTYSTDKISVTGSENHPPTSFNNVTFNGSNFVISLGSADNVLNVNGVSNVALLKDNDIYSYKGHSGGGMDYIAQEGVGISLGAGYTTKNYNGRNRNYQTIDASNVTVTTGIELRANDENSTVIGALTGGALYGGDGSDNIESGLTTGATEASIKAILDGGSDGNDTLVGTDFGIETFVYRGGNDSISGYTAANGDLISIRGFNPGEATIDKKTGDSDGNTLVLTFDAETNALSIAGGASAADDSAISIQSGNRLYTYTKDYVAYNKGITLASDYSSNEFNGAGEGYTDYVTINAAAVSNAISVVGNANNNYIVGSSVASATNGDTLAGGKGNDRIDVNERGDKSNYVFEYTEGKDEVFGFNQTNDKLKITAANIKSAKTGNNKLTLTVKKNSDVLTLRGDEITKVSLASGSGASYLTKDGYVTTEDKTLKLFSSAKGRIELGDQLYSLGSGQFVTTVNADSVENQSVTLVGSSLGGEFKYKSDNKKRDGFVYGGGKVTISGYEPGKDRIDLNGSTLTSFTVDTDGENKGVKLLLNSAGDNQYISVAGAANKEVLLRDGSSRSFKKMVFVQNGILQNKAKNPTMVTVSAGATGSGTDNTYTVADSVKKVFVTEDLKAAIKIQAGNKNNTVIDASKAGFGVSLSGGKKNDKLIGNNANADTFIYSEGKDIIQGYTSTDNISITGSLADSLGSAKITAGSKSIKFKFTNKNTLTVKANKGESLSGALNINGLGQTYAKNAIAKGGAVSLTSAFSGTFKTVGTKGLDGTMTTVNGSAVSKNLTFKGSEVGETLSGGSKKTTFKGGGGADSLVGGSGKDIFFYAKGEKGETTIADFEFGANKDRLKIASGTIGEITSINGGVQFAMNSGKKGDTSNIGWFKITSGYDSSKKAGNQDITAGNVAIKANNTFYWFADKEETIGTGDDALTIKAGQLITSDTRVSASDVSGYDIIDLNYSTNLAKSGVAVKVTSKPTAKSNS